ncbi:NUDIX hydrolase [Kineobactrum sediminis]|uniref:NUDIX hydrolase n=1 Tax=Kineobactrum sediminis TaxID=1905677 RepID=A0A2N5Y3K9_9GAMM|nr:NUDIX hydrolase [Kineobactrum sediminis]PLW82985.1 NUDIX hydrolase [Kineobactrum sediminis]
MIELSDNQVPVHPAATVVVLRDAEAGPEVLLLQRNKALKHMGGEWVFPGGRVDAGDYAEDGDDYTAACNAAIRETREEAGLALTPDQLSYLSHWTTPQGARRRYATWFFLAVLDDAQEVCVDGGEISAHRWLTPQQAFTEIRDTDNVFRLMPPTFVSLADLAPHECIASAQEVVRARQPLMFEPRMVQVEGGICFLYAGDAGYEVCCETVDGPRHRTYMIDYQLDYIRDPGL